MKRGKEALAETWMEELPDEMVGKGRDAKEEACEELEMFLLRTMTSTQQQRTLCHPPSSPPTGLAQA